ncbi:MAG: hypothetical protein ISR60_03560 [Anaerolineales bacterium]|nr:hypothetical protein [Anaerolineales bacterium]
MYRIKSRQSGQGLVEVALVIVLVAVVALLALSALGMNVADVFRNLPFISAGEESKSVLAIKDDFLERINDFYTKNGKWPRSWGTYRFTDIDLNPADWSDPVEGIYWNPHGTDVGLANRSGDNLQIYVDDLDGNTLHLYDGWNIWCRADDGECYYHTVAPGNEVDLSTLVVVED